MLKANIQLMSPNDIYTKTRTRSMRAIESDNVFSFLALEWKLLD